MLAIERLEVRYGGILALRGVSLEVNEGETVLLVGANGAGKSSIINAVMGLVSTCGGTIRFAGADLGSMSCDRRARSGIGFSPEGRRLFPTMSVADNVLSGAYGLGKKRQRESFAWLREAFPLLAARAKQPAGQLSGGEQQIVALARAMCIVPRAPACWTSRSSVSLPSGSRASVTRSGRCNAGAPRS